MFGAQCRSCDPRLTHSMVKLRRAPWSEHAVRRPCCMSLALFRDRGTSPTRMIAATVRCAGCAVRRGGASGAQCGAAFALFTDHAARRARCAAIVQCVRRALQPVSGAPSASAGPPCSTVQCQCSAPRIHCAVRPRCTVRTTHRIADRAVHRPGSGPTALRVGFAVPDQSRACPAGRSQSPGQQITNLPGWQLLGCRLLLGGAGRALEPVLHSMFRAFRIDLEPRPTSMRARPRTAACAELRLALNLGSDSNPISHPPIRGRLRTPARARPWRRRPQAAHDSGPSPPFRF